MATAKKKATGKKAPAKKKTANKKVAAKKAAPKKKVAAKKSALKAKAPKKAAVKKSAGPTATDQVLTLIKRFKNGVGVPAIKEKTGFEDKKVRNIVARAYKQGKIKRSDKGVYSAA